MDTLTPSEKNKMRAARELLREKRYQEAKSLLRGINHPKAHEWRQRIDQILASEPTQIISPPPPSTQQFSFEKNRTASVPPIQTSTKRSHRYLDYQPPRQSQSEKQRRARNIRNNLLILIVLFLCILFPLFVSNYSSSTSNNQSVQQQPTADISARMLSMEPDSIKITDPNNTGIPRSFLDSVRGAIASYGYVYEYEGVMNSDSRFLTFVGVRLSETQNHHYAIARNVIEAVFRLYAKDVEPETTGEVTIFVEWNKGDLPCGLSSGMGYLAIRSINWDTADQAAIFRAIDKNIYEDGLGRGDGLSGKPYSEVAWAPHPNTVTQCYD